MTKINKDRIDSICRDVSNGNYMETAAAANGITKQTVYNWLSHGEELSQRIDDLDALREHLLEGITPQEAAKQIQEDLTEYDILCIDFFDGVSRARAEAEQRMVDVVVRAACDDRDARSALEYLWRTSPGRWSKKERRSVEHSGSIRSVSVEELRRALSGDGGD